MDEMDETIHRSEIEHSGLVMFHTRYEGKWLEVEVHKGKIGLRGPSSVYKDLSQGQVFLLMALLQAALAELDQQSRT